MSGLPKRLDCKGAIKLLEANGWTCAKGGKHVYKMVKAGHRPITIPMKSNETFGPGLTSAILRQAGLIDRGDGGGQQ